MIFGEEAVGPVQAVNGDRVAVPSTGEGGVPATPTSGGDGGAAELRVLDGKPGPSAKASIINDLIQLCFTEDETGRVIAQVKDAATGEVIRQIPPEEVLKVAKLIDQYLGLFVDRQR